MTEHIVELHMLVGERGRVTKWRFTCTCGRKGAPMTRDQALASGRAHVDSGNEQSSVSDPSTEGA